MNQEILSLRKDEIELHSILNHGTLLRHGEYWRAVPREVVSNSQGIESIIFELARISELAQPSFFKKWWQAIRPQSLTLTLMPWMTLLVYGLSRGWEVSWSVGLSSAMGALLFQISVNVLNDVEDHLRFLDVAGAPGGSGVIQKGWLNARQMKNLGHGALIAGILMGLPAVFRAPEVLLWIGVLAVFGVLSYSNRPFGIKYRTLGDFSIFVFLGPLLAFGFSQALFLQMDPGVFWIGMFFGFAAWGTSIAKKILDLGSTRSQGYDSLVTRLGFKRSRHFFALVYGLAFLFLELGVILQYLPLALGLSALLSLPWAWKLVSRAYQASGPVSALLGPIRNEAMQVHFYMGCFALFGLSWILL